MGNMRKIFIFLCLFILLFTTSLYKISASAEIIRLAGTDRYETSIKVSQDGWTQSDYVVLVSGENFPDGICAAPLAKKYNAPILLTQYSSLNPNIVQ